MFADCGKDFLEMLNSFLVGRMSQVFFRADVISLHSELLISSYFLVFTEACCLLSFFFLGGHFETPLKVQLGCGVGCQIEWQHVERQWGEFSQRTGCLAKWVSSEWCFGSGRWIWREVQSADCHLCRKIFWTARNIILQELRGRWKMAGYWKHALGAIEKLPASYNWGESFSCGAVVSHDLRICLMFISGSQHVVLPIGAYWDSCHLVSWMWGFVLETRLSSGKARLVRRCL